MMDNIKKHEQDHQVTWLKVAVAVAIIRNKPVNLSAREFAEKMCSDFSVTQMQLQRRYEQAQTQIEHLKLQLMTDKQTSCRDGPEQSGASLQIPGEAENLLTPPLSAPSASCGIPSQHDPVPPIIGQPLFDNHQQGETIITETSKFIQSVESLKNLFSQMPVELNDRATMAQMCSFNVCVMKDILNCDTVILSEACLCEGARTVTALIDRNPWLEECPLFMQEACSMVDRIIQKLSQSPSHQGQFPPHRLKNSLVKMLLEFMKGGSLPLTSCIVESLAESVCVFCKTLQTSQKSGTPVDPDIFESSYFVLRCLELWMLQWSVEYHFPPELLQELQLRLERSFFQVHLTRRFPLITHALRRVASLIESVLQNV